VRDAARYLQQGCPSWPHDPSSAGWISGLQGSPTSTAMTTITDLTSNQFLSVTLHLIEQIVHLAQPGLEYVLSAGLHWQTRPEPESASDTIVEVGL